MESPSLASSAKEPIPEGLAHCHPAPSPHHLHWDNHSHNSYHPLSAMISQVHFITIFNSQNTGKGSRLLHFPGNWDSRKLNSEVTQLGESWTGTWLRIKWLQAGTATLTWLGSHVLPVSWVAAGTAWWHWSSLCSAPSPACPITSLGVKGHHRLPIPVPQPSEF